MQSPRYWAGRLGGKRLKSFSLVVFLFLGWVAAGPALAFTLDIGPDGGEPVRAYDLDDLKAFEQHDVVTGNEFVEGEPTFSGPLMRDVLADAGFVDARIVRLTAANDYAVEVETAEFVTYDVILALSMDGTPLTRRDKGPVWVIYPMRDNPELQDPVFNNRLIWQLVKIEAR